MQISHDFIAIKTSLIIVFNAAYRIGENEKRDVILGKCLIITSPYGAIHSVPDSAILLS